MNYKKLVREILSEIEVGSFIPTVYPSLDWDDNIMRMPTKIYLLDKEGRDVGMSTEDFAEYRGMIGKEQFEYEGHTIVGYSPDALVDFKTTGDRKFLEDIETAPLVRVGWEKLRDAINNGVIFAIITARGHHPNTLKKAVLKLISMERGGIDKNQMLNSLRKFRETMKLKPMSDSELVRDYLNRCVFVPVSFESDEAASPEELKFQANKNFHDYVSALSYRLQKKAYFDDQIGDKGPIESGFLFVEPEVHFLDDDEKNAIASSDRAKETGLKSLRTFLTKSGEEEEIKENKLAENIIARIKRRIF